MKLRISPTILDEVNTAIEDALAHQGRGTSDPTDPTYLKIDAAATAARSHKRGFLIEAEEEDLTELRSRAEYNVGPDGVCQENLRYAYDKHERIYWLNRIRAYQSLLKQIDELMTSTPSSPSTAPSLEITMTTRIALSNTQYEILEQAIDHNHGQIVWFPDNVKGGARHKVLQGLLNKAMITRDDQDNHFVTAEGYVALGRDFPVPATTHPDPEVEAAVSAAEANWTQEKETAQRLLKVGVEGKPLARENSKQATVIQMLKRPEGATIGQICEATGWQAHTVRGTFAGTFKKKLGLDRASEKSEGGERTYRIV